jgi:hypothetical protein
MIWCLLVYVEVDFMGFEATAVQIIVIAYTGPMV